MAKGNPNPEEEKLNFIAKVRDPHDNTWKPLYKAPDATDKVQGDVYLSDATDGEDNAAEGMTAATNTQYLGSMEKQWNTIYATNFRGNATSASKLETPKNVGIKNGQLAEVKAEFDGVKNVTINLNNLDASTLSVGTVPIERLPHGALERLHKITSLEDLMTNSAAYDVQIGDSVYDLETELMYIVVGEDLTKPDSYMQYTASIATQARALTPGATIQTNLSSEAALNFTGETSIQPGITGILPVTHGGSGTSDGIPTKTNPGLVPMLPDNENSDQMFLNGNYEWKKVITEIVDGSITTEKLADSAVNFTKLNSEIQTLYVGTSEPMDSHVNIWIIP